MLAFEAKTKTFPLPLSVEGSWDIVKTTLDLRERTSYHWSETCPFLAETLRLSRVENDVAYVNVPTGAKKAFPDYLLEQLRWLCQRYMGVADVMLDIRSLPTATGIVDPECFQKKSKESWPKPDVDWHRPARKPPLGLVEQLLDLTTDEQLDADLDSDLPDVNLPLKQAILKVVTSHYDLEPEDVQTQRSPRISSARREAMGLTVDMLTKNNIVPFAEVGEFYNRTVDEVMRAYTAVMGGLRTARLDARGRPNITPLMKKMDGFRQAAKALVEAPLEQTMMEEVA